MLIPMKNAPLGNPIILDKFELIIKPGILSENMTYGITPYWNETGYCIIDWGDGNQERVENNGIQLNHTYNSSGTYTVKITARCYQLIAGSELLYSCSENWDSLGNITGSEEYLNMMFNGSINMMTTINTLPTNLQYANRMFEECNKLEFNFTELSDSIINARSMFFACTNAQLPLNKLSNNLIDGSMMFSECPNAELPLSSLPPSLLNANYMFSRMYKCTTSLIQFAKRIDKLYGNV